jgi:hypothetical protein
MAQQLQVAGGVPHQHHCFLEQQGKFNWRSFSMTEFAAQQIFLFSMVEKKKILLHRNS